MKLDFILSNTLQGSVLGAVDEIIDLSNKNEQVLVLVPEDSSLAIEKLLLSKSKALCNVNVYSFVRLLEKINNTKKNQYIDRDCGVLIVRKIILDNFDNLICFKKSAKSLGFAELIYDTIAQLKASRISPLEVLNMQETVSQSLKIKLHDIAIIYKAYSEFLVDRYLDNCDKLDLLLSEVANSELVLNSKVFVVGFSNLTAQGAELVENLASVSRGVTVACSYLNKNASNFHISDNELYEKIKHIADKHKISYNPKIYNQKFSNFQKHLANNLYAYPYKTTLSDGAVTLFEGINVSSEVEFVANQIYNDLYNKKIKPNEVCLVVSDIETYKGQLLKTFADKNLPLFINDPQSLSSHPLFCFIKKALDCIKRGFETNDVLIFAKNILFDFGFECDIFENYCLKYGIDHYAFLKPFVYGEKDESFNVSENIRKQISDCLINLKQKLSGCENTLDFCLAIEGFLVDFNILEKLDKLYKLQISLDSKSAKITEQVFFKFEKMFENFKSFLGDCECDLDTFISLFDAAILTTKINILPLNLSCIECFDTTINIRPNLKQLYVLGAIDGVIPFRKDDCGLIADNELGSLSDIAQKKIEPTIKTVNRRERLNCYNMLLLPSEKLTLTYPAFDLVGNECKPSSLIDNISKLFLEKELPLRILTSFENELKYSSANNNLALYFGAKNNAEKKLIELVKQEQNNICKMDNKNISALYFALKDNLSDVSKNIIENINEPNSFEKIKDAKNLYFKKGTVSISELEKYFSCPYSHFAVYGLGLKERELGGIRAVDVGIILHKVAELFEKEIEKVNENNLKFVANKVIEKSITELEIPQENNALVLKILKGEALRLCNMLYKEKQNSNFKTVATELSFGYFNDNTKFSSGIKLVGKIDRVDVCDDFFKLIDYKTGHINVSSEDVYYGRKIQLISYMCAMDGWRNLRPVAALYFPIRNEFAKGEDKVLDLYKNSGLIENRNQVVFSIDNTLNLENTKSHIIKAELANNAEIRKTGELKLKQSDDLVDYETIKGLMNYVYKLSDNAISEILNGYAMPSPIVLSNGELPCKYCPLAHCCGVENTQFAGGRKIASKISYEQVAKVDYE